MLSLDNVTILPLPSRVTHIHYQPHVHLLVFPIEGDVSWAVHLWRN